MLHRNDPHVIETGIVTKVYYGPDGRTPTGQYDVSIMNRIQRDGALAVYKQISAIPGVVDLIIHDIVDVAKLYGSRYLPVILGKRAITTPLSPAPSGMWVMLGQSLARNYSAVLDGSGFPTFAWALPSQAGNAPIPPPATPPASALNTQPVGIHLYKPLAISNGIFWSTRNPLGSFFGLNVGGYLSAVDATTGKFFDSPSVISQSASDMDFYTTGLGDTLISHLVGATQIYGISASALAVLKFGKATGHTVAGVFTLQSGLVWQHSITSGEGISIKTDFVLFEDNTLWGVVTMNDGNFTLSWFSLNDSDGTTASQTAFVFNNNLTLTGNPKSWDASNNLRPGVFITSTPELISGETTDTLTVSGPTTETHWGRPTEYHASLIDTPTPSFLRVSGMNGERALVSTAPSNPENTTTGTSQTSQIVLWDSVALTNYLVINGFATNPPFIQEYPCVIGTIGNLLLVYYEHIEAITMPYTFELVTSIFQDWFDEFGNPEPLAFPPAPADPTSISDIQAQFMLVDGKILLPVNRYQGYRLYDPTVLSGDTRVVADTQTALQPWKQDPITTTSNYYPTVTIASVSGDTGSPGLATITRSDFGYDGTNVISGGLFGTYVVNHVGSPPAQGAFINFGLPPDGSPHFDFDSETYDASCTMRHIASYTWKDVSSTPWYNTFQSNDGTYLMFPPRAGTSGSAIGIFSAQSLNLLFIIPTPELDVSGSIVSRMVLIGGLGFFWAKPFGGTARWYAVDPTAGQYVTSPNAAPSGVTNLQELISINGAIFVEDNANIIWRQT